MTRTPLHLNGFTKVKNKYISHVYHKKGPLSDTKIIPINKGKVRAPSFWEVLTDCSWRERK